MTRIKEYYSLLETLCTTKDDVLQAVLISNINEYKTVREAFPSIPFETANFAPTNNVRGFVACCLDSLCLLSATLPSPSEFMLSISQQNTFTQVLQMLFGFGVSALCDKGVCPMTPRCQVERYEPCPIQRNVELVEIARVVERFVQDSYYGSLVLSKHLGILIAACVQILYGPNNPNRIIRQKKCDVLVAKSSTIDIDFVKAFLDELLYKSPRVASEIVSLQLPKGTSKPPAWLLAVTNDLMRLQVLRPSGVMDVTRQLFEHYGGILAYEDQGFCDKVSSVIVSAPRVKPLEYITNITEQVSVMLDEINNVALRKQYLRLYKNLVHKLSADYPNLVFEKYWCEIFRPCIIWKQNDEVFSSNKMLLNQKDAHLWLVRLKTISSMGLFQSNLSDKLNSEFLTPLLFLYHHVFKGISPHKTTVAETIAELMGASSSWKQSVFDLLSADFSKDRNLNWRNGDSGGFVLTYQVNCTASSNNLSLDPNDILGGDDNIVDVTMKLLKSLPEGRDDQLSDFFLQLFRDVIASANDSGDEKADNFLDCPVDLLHFQISLRKGLLLEKTCQAFGQRLLKKTSQTISLLKLIILQKSENPSYDKDELLTTSFGILGTYMRDEVELSESDESEIKSLMEPLKKIVDTSGNHEIVKLANDLRICMATKINLESLPSFATKDDEKDRYADLSNIVKDLGDSFIPSRAHAIIQLGKQFANKNPLVIENIELLQTILLENLTHDDSYVFLAAVKCLGQISWCNTQVVLDRIIQEILNPGRKEDDRAKCMEVLVNIIEITNDMLPKYESQIFNCLLTCVNHQSDEIVRVSSLGCLGDLCKVCKYGCLNHIQEIIDVCERTLMEDQSELAKRAAIVTLANFIECQDKSLFHEQQRETLRVYRLLKKVTAMNFDKEVQRRALQALGVLSGIVREFMFPKTKIQHEVKIL